MEVEEKRGPWAKIGLLVTIGVPFSSCGSEKPPEEVERVMDQAPAPALATPTRPWPTGLNARFELPMPGRPEGVIVADANGDGRPEIIATCRSGSGGGAVLRTFGADLSTHVSVAVPDWPLAPVALGTPSLFAVASRSTHELLILDLSQPKGQEIVRRQTLSAAPVAIAQGPALFQQALFTLAIATRAGDLWLFPVQDDRAAPLGEPYTLPLADPHTTFLAVEASMVVAGSMGSGDGGQDRLRRYMVSAPGVLTANPPEPLPGIPRDWLVTPTTELLAGGDHDLWNHDGSQWNDFGQAGRAPLRLLGLGGERFACLSADLTLRVLGMQGVEDSFYCGQDAWDLAGGDLDGDSLTDLVLANRDAERISVLFSDASGSWRRARSLPTAIAPLVLVAADFNASGAADLLTVDASTDGLSFFSHRRGDYHLQPQPSPGPGIREALAYDLNRDSHLDLVLRARDAVRLMEGDGTGQLGEPQQYLVPGVGPMAAHPSGILVAGTGGIYRVAHESDTSLIAMDETCSALAVLPDGRVAVGIHGERQGLLLLDDKLQPGEFLPLPGKPLDLAAQAMEPGGDIHLVALLQGPWDNAPGKLLLLKPKGNASFAPVQEEAVGFRPHALALGDLNGDGMMEVAISAQNSHHINLFQFTTNQELVRLPDLGAGRGPLDLTFIPNPPDSPSRGATLVIGCNFSNEILLITN